MIIKINKQKNYKVPKFSKSMLSDISLLIFVKYTKQFLIFFTKFDKFHNFLKNEKILK